MAITDVPAFTHLTEADIENLGNELDAIRQDIEDSRGERDSRYIRRTIAAQRALEVAGRLMLAAGSKRSAWWAGTVTLGVAKIVENMEIGHNVMHGQWDWMNDPEIHSSTWEWDMSGASKHWRFTHNFMHHKYTNILGMDDDVGYGVIRVTRDAKWTPFNLYGNLLFNTLLAIGFEWGVGLQHLELGKISKGRDDREATMERIREFGVKAGHQLLKDYVAYPALTSLSPLTVGDTSTRTSGRNTCTIGPIVTAYSTVPMPTVPPSTKPTASTVTSMTVRQSRTLRPVRRTRPSHRPSRGPGPSAAPM
jgi:linoleoyl-CoA desaturase